MSRRHLRHDPVCQNCGDIVQKRFCGNCGQENTETRQSFGHLLRHFIEDLTHYDTAFWLTLRYLLFRPAYLTKAYLSGKRNSFVPPVRLYIFISFVTFLLPYVLPDFSTPPDDAAEKVRQASDTVGDAATRAITFELEKGIVKVPRYYKSAKQFDSIQNTLPEQRRTGPVGHWLSLKYIPLQKYNKFELGDRFFESFTHNFPKALFFYLPLFAFVLWLFHGKRRWIYFDHAIFTLHYFSFLLLVFNLMSLTNEFFFLSEDAFLAVIVTTFIIITLAIFIYFFIAHKRMYEESRLVSFTKSIFIYSINLLLFFAVLVVFAFISIFTIH